MGDAWNARIPSNSMPWLAVRLRRKFSANRPSDGYTPSTCPTSSIRKRRATSTMVRYSVVRRTLAGRATLPISRSNPPESAPSDRTARSGSDRMYLYRTGELTLCSIRGGRDVVEKQVWGRQSCLRTRFPACPDAGQKPAAARIGCPTKLSNLRHVTQEPREKAAADDDDDWISWHDPLIGGMGGGLYRCRSIPAGALMAAPERKVRGTLAVRGTPSGIQALTCVTPAYTRPANVAGHGGASMPPTLTLHGAAGAGYGGGVGRRPSAMAGVRTPSPVRKKVITEPGAGGTKSALQESTPPALSLITSASQGLLGQEKMPGNAAATGTATGGVAVPWYSTDRKSVVEGKGGGVGGRL